MIIQRNKLFTQPDSEGKLDKDRIKATTGVVVGSATLGSIKSGRLTGKVVRYHNASKDVLDKIKKEGIKASYSTDPHNLTNTALPHIPMSEKEGLVYTAKSKSTANKIGLARALRKGDYGFVPALNQNFIEDSNRGSSRYAGNLKVEFDYDDIKSSPRINNPEIRPGVKTGKAYYESLSPDQPSWESRTKGQQAQYNQAFKSLKDDTHVFKGDISSKNIVGGEGYKKRTLSQVGKYIKNNPARFGKEAAKVAAGSAVLAYGAKKGYDVYKKKQARDDYN